MGQFPLYKLENSPFKDYTFVYAVSVGNDHFEDDWVGGYVNFLKSVGSRKASVLVADSLQRHNLSGCYSDAQAKASEFGQIWAKKYKPLFDTLGENVQHEFVHWEQYRQHPHFVKYLRYMENLEANGPGFQAVLSESISDYMRRSAHEDISCTVEEKAKKSADYFMEECAVTWIIAQNPELKGILYPSKVVKPIGYTLELINQSIRKENRFLYFELYPKKQKT